jgi:D-beta-D-heptose 7-phosphate kinase/D-beta-D-heptose 1-phosphate adenosyltransferase
MKGKAEIISFEEFDKKRSGLGKIVSTSGGFDPLHPGHANYILESSKLGDTMVVVVNGDNFLRRKKGKPFMDLKTRCEIVSHLKGVDYVIPFEIENDQTAIVALEKLRPNIFTKSGDRINKETIPEWNTCQKYNIEIVVLPADHNVDVHSSLFLNKWAKYKKVEKIYPFLEKYKALKHSLALTFPFLKKNKNYNSMNTESKVIKKEICPLCKTDCEQKFVRSHIDKVTNQKYDLYQCENCFAQHWFPMQNPGGYWYERDERYANRNIDPTIIPGLQHIASVKKMKKIGGKSVLDVGCGNGNFLAYAEKNGFKGVGFDFDRDGIESGKRSFGLSDLFVDDLAGYKSKHPEEKDKYDWVTFFDVFEHIDNHNEFIDDVKFFLKTGGHIALSIPHRDSAPWLIPGDLPPRHLTRWNPKSITKFFEARGFDHVDVGFIPATLDFLVTKLRWKYGKHFNFNLVGKVKQKEAKESYKNCL